MYVATGGPSIKLGSHILNVVPGTTGLQLATVMCRMSIQSCYFCVRDVEILWFWMCLRQVSILCHFCLFFKLVLGVLPTPAHGLLGHSPCLCLLFILENASLLYVFVPPPTVPLHKVVNSGYFHCGPCHCSYIFVAPSRIIILKAHLTHRRSLCFVHTVFV